MSVPYPRPLTYALYASGHSVQAGGFICPVYGEVQSLAAYREVRINQYETLGTTNPAVQAVSAPWAVVIDQRRFGSEARFARRGCHPNAVVRPVISRMDEADGGELEVSFAMFALTDIGRREEIILPWDWDDRTFESSTVMRKLTSRT